MSGGCERNANVVRAEYVLTETHIHKVSSYYIAGHWSIAAITQVVVVWFSFSDGDERAGRDCRSRSYPRRSDALNNRILPGIPSHTIYVCGGGDIEVYCVLEVRRVVVLQTHTLSRGGGFPRVVRQQSRGGGKRPGRGRDQKFALIPIHKYTYIHTNTRTQITHTPFSTNINL